MELALSIGEDELSAYCSGRTGLQGEDVMEQEPNNPELKEEELDLPMFVCDPPPRFSLFQQGRGTQQG